MAYRAPARFVPPITGSVDQRLSLLTDAISKKADQTLMPVYSAVQLIASDGSTWALTVGTDGTLQTAVVPR